MANTKVDQTIDADLAASNARAADGSRTLGAEEAIAALTGKRGAPAAIPDEEGSLSEARRHPDFMDGEQPIEDTPADAESPTPDEGSLSDDSGDSTTSKPTEESTDSDTDSDSAEDYFVGIDDNDDLGIKIVPKATAAPTDTPIAKANLTPDERVTLWQSRAQKFEQQFYDMQKKVSTLESERDALQHQLVTVQAASGAKPFDKKPKDFMDDGESYDPEDRTDPGTPSGQAYQRYVESFRKYEKEQLITELEARQEAKRQRDAAQTAYNEQIEYLRTKRKGEFTSDTDVEELITWSQSAGKKGLYALSIVRDLFNGTFRLPDAAVKQIIARTQPRNGKSAPASISNKSEAPQPRQEKVDPTIAQLRKAGFLDARVGY